MRAHERGTKHRKKEPVPAIPKTHQMLKSINKMKNQHQQNEKSASTNEQNSQLASKWQYQIHT